MTTTESTSLWADIPLQRGIQLSVLLLMMLMIGAAFTFQTVTAKIPLFYSRPWGLQQLAPEIALLVLALSGAGVVVIHVIGASIVFHKNKLAAHLVIWTGVILLFFLLLSVATVYLRVGPQA